MKNYLLFTMLMIGFSGALQAQTMNEIQGLGAGVSLTNGSYNTLYGDSAGTNITSGWGHVVIGAGAGHSLTTSGSTSFTHLNPPPHIQFSFCFGQYLHWYGRRLLSDDRAGQYCHWKSCRMVFDIGE